MEVDHFDPTKKKDYIQNFKNLFPATRHCNGAKGQKWPSKLERELGLRFLNPCDEQDYGVHIFEDRKTHRLVGITPAGRYHIRHCDLNADHLVTERADRAKLLRVFRSHKVRLKSGTFEKVTEVIDALKEQVELMIPEFPYIDSDPSTAAQNSA